MARWRLMTAHYLNVPGTEWEYKEVSNTGEAIRKMFKVPKLLDPNDPRVCNYPGECIVCHEGKGAPKDIVFVGDPTMDMTPVDEEAEAISRTFEAKWQHPIESLSGDMSQSIITALERQITKLAQGGAQSVSTKGVDPAAFEALQKQVADLMAQNAILAEQAESRSTRRA